MPPTQTGERVGKEGFLEEVTHKLETSQGAPSKGEEEHPKQRNSILGAYTQ